MLDIVYSVNISSLPSSKNDQIYWVFVWFGKYSLHILKCEEIPFKKFTFVPVHAVTVFGGVMLQLHLFLTFTPNGGDLNVIFN
jgi:hypothetical protein